jgi:hypothetical protein
MKRAIAGILLMVGMAAAPALARDSDRGLRRDIRHDEREVAHDRRELRRDLRKGNYAAARHARRELRREYRDLRQDRRELYWRYPRFVNRRKKNAIRFARMALVLTSLCSIRLRPPGSAFRRTSGTRR